MLCCRDTEIEELPDFPAIEALVCSNTLISSIRIYPNLVELCCSNTPIREIGSFPNLVHLECNSSMVEKISSMDTLFELECANTNIVSLPVFLGLNMLKCDYNKIRYIPRLPHLDFIEARGCRFLLENRSNCEGDFRDCVWLKSKNGKYRERVRHVIFLQRAFRKFIKRKRFIIRLVLIKRLPLELVNLVLDY